MERRAVTAISSCTMCKTTLDGESNQHEERYQIKWKK